MFAVALHTNVSNRLSDCADQSRIFFKLQMLICEPSWTELSLVSINVICGCGLPSAVHTTVPLTSEISNDLGPSETPLNGNYDKYARIIVFSAVSCEKVCLS